MWKSIDSLIEFSVEDEKSFESVCLTVLHSLQDILDFELWMVKIVDGNDLKVLEVCDQEYGFISGNVFDWNESFCIRMADGRGPNFAPDSSKDRVYSESKFCKTFAIKAYMGFPLRNSNGRLIGTLSAMSSSVVPEEWAEFEPFVEHVASQLERVYQHQYNEANAKLANRMSLAEAPQVKKAILEPDWETFVSMAEDRPKASRNIDSIVHIQVSAGANNEQIVINSLRHIIGMGNRMVPQGNGLYSIILFDCNAPQLAVYVNCIRETLTNFGIGHCIGFASTSYSSGHVLADELAMVALGGHLSRNQAA